MIDRIRAAAAAAIPLFAAALTSCSETSRGLSPVEAAEIRTQVETAVWAFHRADTARDAEAVIDLLWPEFTMLVDGSRQNYEQIAAGSREFMSGIRVFHTEWTDLTVTPLASTIAVASFTFRDSIVSRAGELTQAMGPTTFVWERRQGEWRLRFADADHYPVSR